MDKVKVLEEWPTPGSVKEVQQVVGIHCTIGKAVASRRVKVGGPVGRVKF